MTTTFCLLLALTAAAADLVSDPGPTRPSVLNDPSSPVVLRIRAETAERGRVLIADVEARPHLAISSVEVRLGKHAGVAFPVAESRRSWTLLAPVDIEAQKKPLPLVVEVTLGDGHRARMIRSVSLLDGNYDHRSITVDKKFLKPSASQRRRSAREAKELKAALATTSPVRLWRGTFVKPTLGAQTSPFGTLRTYNKKRRSRHLGLDLDGAVGAPIVAANRGAVLLATERFYSGGTVVIDHGQGLMTVYFHMSRIGVTVGDEVDKGQEIGLVGATGQVTGPHLHFSVRLGGLYVDPGRLLLLDLSNDADAARSMPSSSSSLPAPTQKIPEP